MAFVATTPRQTHSSAGAWRHPPRARQTRALLCDMTKLLGAAVAGALATGMLATLVLMSGAAQAHVPEMPGMPQTRILEPADLAPSPICTCLLPPLSAN